MRIQHARVRLAISTDMSGTSVTAPPRLVKDCIPAALSFLGEFIRRASLLGYLSEGPVAETVRTEAQQILLRLLRDVTWLEYIPSALAAAALHWASYTSSPGVAPTF